MANPTLNEEQRKIAMEIVAGVSARLHALAAGDESLLFAYIRKVSKQLVYLERDSPSKRKRVKKKVWKSQHELCAECKQPLELRYSIADRIDAVKRYIPENLEIIHDACNRARLERKGYV
jgi:hypothetical protein